MGSLEPMKITGYTDKQFTKRFPGLPYLMMLNPESVKWQRSIEYNQQQAPDSSSPSQRYKSTPSDKLNFDVVIDCTGIVDAKRTDMAKEITTLENIIFTYNGNIHRPNFVKVQWGKDLVFNGVLNSFDISYTLFRPDGSPLRAKISLGFGQYIAPQTVKIQDQDESPDISHLVTMVEGDTLPGLCEKVWNDEKYYIQVARYNGLNKFRNLKGNEKLIFPPIIPTT
ncbi:hypothetical protein [Pedobacter miscanthi]|jgi:hypothetical protein|uniref:CIS tube protein n=1 Tax=Pedobacter miscanthi TaxID=2259170 RepID=UPI002931532F|nr:hypothetical protein [Pedobacter miscanthi]